MLKAWEMRRAADHTTDAQGVGAERTYLACLSADQMLMIPVERMRHIAPVGDIAPFPDAPPHVLGRTQIGGALVALIDLGQLIGASRDPNAVHDPDARALCLEVQGDDGVIHVGLRVDAVTGVGRLDGDEMTPLAAQGMLNWDSRMVEGVGHYQECAVTVLNVDGLLSTAVLAEAMEGGDDA